MSIIKSAEALGLTPFLKKGQPLSGPLKSIKVHYSPRKQSFSRELQEKIAIEWSYHLVINPNDFDGKLASVIAISISNDKAIIKTRESTFSTFLSLKETRPSKIDLNCTPLDKRNCLPLSVGAIAITNDNKVIVATRSNTAFDCETLTFLPGGYIDPVVDIEGQDISVPFCINRELKEELGVSSYENSKYLGIVYSKESSKQPLIALRLKLFESSERIQNTYTGNNESYDLYFIDNNVKTMASFLKDKKIAIHDAWKAILHFS